MQVGDLVRFSAAGKKVVRNWNVARHNPIGIIVRRQKSHWWPSPRFYVKWCRPQSGTGNRKRYLLRKDLKYAK